MADSQITVQYERKFSDGDYGSEGLSMSITMTIEHAALGDGVLKRYAQDLRREVLTELAGSRAFRVATGAARELNGPHAPVPPVAPDRGPDSLEDIPF